MALCQLIPLVGPIVSLGYGYEVVEYLHRKRGRNYPDFDFNRFVKYLGRGIWPFLVLLIVSVPMMFVYFLVWIMFAGVISVVGKDLNPLAGIALFAAGFLFVIGSQVLLALVAVPLSLHAGLSQELAFASAWKFLCDFLKRVWQELLLVQLFLWGSSLVVTLMGLLACCVGVYPAVALILLAQHHLHFQLYELYLERGGREIPIMVDFAK